MVDKTLLISDTGDERLSKEVDNAKNSVISSYILVRKIVNQQPFCMLVNPSQ
ncbi:hypothetical protein EGR_08891 [Echinococcus granulosus]|uniref:Uncharacterized protein n=1 Tax=Echinococcus granulosus TaxID=6210 RepID=W6US18_ECHGR|nr:hypothetical protein EGR_08891 [Echinococcus granulosus]EUB56229.1 hypothetical protein EGR_08891 [Echinococcus granulosus]